MSKLERAISKRFGNGFYRCSVLCVGSSVLIGSVVTMLAYFFWKGLLTP